MRKRSELVLEMLQHLRLQLSWIERCRVTQGPEKATNMADDASEREFGEEERAPRQAQSYNVSATRDGM